MSLLLMALVIMGSQGQEMDFTVDIVKQCAISFVCLHWFQSYSYFFVKNFLLSFLSLLNSSGAFFLLYKQLNTFNLTACMSCWILKNTARLQKGP